MQSIRLQSFELVALCVCYIPPLRVLKNVLVKAILQLVAKGRSRLPLALQTYITSIRSKHSTFIIPAPFHPLSSSRIGIHQYKQTLFLRDHFHQVLQLQQEICFSSASLVKSVRAYTATKLTASLLLGS